MMIPLFFSTQKTFYMLKQPEKTFKKIVGVTHFTLSDHFKNLVNDRQLSLLRF